jgi:hypothetical protein
LASGRHGFVTAPRLMRIYLNDHLAGATAGLELAKRTLKNNTGTPLGDVLSELIDEIRKDRQALLDLLARLGLRRDPVKAWAAWSAEKVGRLKLNGRIRGYSELSRVVELEGLCLGLEGKRAGWRALMEALGDARAGDFTLGQLIERANAQRARLERFRLEAAAQAFRDGAALHAVRGGRAD